MASAFDRLHPNLRHAIVHDLGWRALRAVQEDTIGAVLDGCNAVVLAPTAGGKTEASVFPVLSEILTSEAPPVAALYLCPIRALLNNQEPRLRGYARMVGLDGFKWHGDVAASKKTRFAKEPAHVLMTTPESLEVMLISSRVDAARLLAPLRAVVVDEIHAFAGDDRGAHLAGLLERVGDLCKRDLQRIGLSATVGNPEEIGRWLQGSSERPFRLVDPPKAPAPRDLGIDLCEDDDTLAQGIAKLARGKKTLVFVQSRAQAERVAHTTAGRGVEVFVHHSAVSRQDRRLAEERFARGSNTAIVCTSTMELGIDVGDLDHVAQVDAPSTVASFLQRLGRTGRREGTKASCRFFCRSPESLLQAVAICRLADRGYVEDVRPVRRAMHVLAHQILALTLQDRGISRHRVLPRISAASPFADLAPAEVDELVDTMVERTILHESDGLLSLGARGEKLYGRRNFFELYAVFGAPATLRVVHGRDDVGTVQAAFLQSLGAERQPIRFRLAGRSWQTVGVQWTRGVVQVRPAEDGRVPSWLGQPAYLPRATCQEMRDALLTEGQEHSWLTPAAQRELDPFRAEYADLLSASPAPLESLQDGLRWHTFAGGATNRLLAAALEQQTHHTWRAGNLSLRSPDCSLAEAGTAIAELPSVDLDAVATALAPDLARGPVSKFQACLADEAVERLMVERLLEVEETRAFLAAAKGYCATVIVE